jgi:uncharacterized protein (DUF2235 family)
MPQINSAQETPQGKNILIFCDGTGNKFIDQINPGGSNSNVVKLYTTMKIDSQQVAYYHPGVGTAGDPAARSWIAKKWSTIKGLAFAFGFRDNVLDAYHYLMENYKDGDRVFLFGFSRGAYTVRALGGLLDGYGLLCKGNEGHLPYAWTEFTSQLDNRKLHHVKPNERFKETFAHKNFRIHFMGIWDTVSSVGWIRTPLRLYSVAHNRLIDTGRHAISIDESRCFYRDNLWTGADESRLVKNPSAENQPKPHQDLLQIWFAGVHSDIGGSYPQEQSGLSNIALEWMIREAKAAGAKVEPALCDLVLGKHTELTAALGKHVEPTGDPDEDERRSKLAEKIKQLHPLYPHPASSEPHKSLHSIWWLLELFPHRYYDKDDTKESLRTPLGMRRRIPSGSYIHHTVIERMAKHRDYAPKNLLDRENSLKVTSIASQDPGTVYLYQPANDSQPVLNKPAMRWFMIVLVTALDVVAAFLLLALVGVICCWTWNHIILWLWHNPILWLWNLWVADVWNPLLRPAWDGLYDWVRSVCSR